MAFENVCDELDQESTEPDERLEKVTEFNNFRLLKIFWVVLLVSRIHILK